MPLPGLAHQNVSGVSGALLHVPFPFGPNEVNAQVPSSAMFRMAVSIQPGCLQTQVEEGHQVDSFTSSKLIYEQELNTYCT